jgi:ribosomal RNA assembly protein
MEYTYDMRVPKDRVAVLIGKNGEVKKKIEKSSNVKLDIDSKEGEVVITGEEGLSLYAAKEIIRAIARGFNPEFALRLLKTDYILEMFDIKNFANSNNAMLRLKGRVIGSEGKSRKIIENLTETSICVYGKTIGILGESQNVAFARKAIENLLKGARHSSVYKWLEKKCKELRKMERVGLEEFDLNKDIKEDTE